MKIESEYITLGQLLKAENFVSSGGEVKHRIVEMLITVNGEHDNRRGRKIYPGDRVVIDGAEILIES